MIPVLSHFVGCGPVWFWIRTVSPTANGGRRRVCSVHRSADIMCLFRSAFSLYARVSLHVGCGSYRPGSMGMKSLIGRPKIHMAGDSFVSGSGVFRYWRMARWSLSVSSSPLGPVLEVMMRFAVFTPISARQLECGKATEESR